MRLFGGLSPDGDVVSFCHDAGSRGYTGQEDELKAVGLPGEGQEAIRNLKRAREDMKANELRARKRVVSNSGC